MAVQKGQVRAGAVLAGLALVAGGLTGCSLQTDAAASGSTASSLWDSGAVHSIAVDVDDDDYDALIAAYVDSGDKEWVSATVTIDGTTLTQVGLKLKGNSSLREISAASDAETLPWIIRLDKYVDGQNYDGETELVVRGNTSETALNEALALDLLRLSGLASEEAISSTFSVNDGESALRLVIQNPSDEWASQEFESVGLLYKAESTGDYTYRGDDPESYTDVFDQEAGDENLEPLIDFLQFINESDDASFASDLSEWLDVDSFATYLAFQDLIDNFDDISGPGNNSYLRFDEETGLMTVVSWDLNLAFGARNDGGGDGAVGGGPGGERPAGDLPAGEPPTGTMPTDLPTGDLPAGEAPDGAAGGGPGGVNTSNVLADRFLADPAFSVLYDSAVTELTATLFTSGEAESLLDEWTATLTSQADGLVSEATITEESEALRTKIEAVAG